MNLKLNPNTGLVRSQASTNRIAVLEAEAELTQRELAKALTKNQQMEKALKESLATSASLSQEQANTAGAFV